MVTGMSKTTVTSDSDRESQTSGWGSVLTSTLCSTRLVGDRRRRPGEGGWCLRRRGAHAGTRWARVFAVVSGSSPNGIDSSSSVGEERAGKSGASRWGRSTRAGGDVWTGTVFSPVTCRLEVERMVSRANVVFEKQKRLDVKSGMARAGMVAADGTWHKAG